LAGQLDLAPAEKDQKVPVVESWGTNPFTRRRVSILDPNPSDAGLAPTD
jgi:hypothetical protein